MTDHDVQVLGLAGSLRRGSFNRALLRAAAALAPAETQVTPFELHDVPLYDGDVEQRGDPEPVQRLKRAIADADALLVATPEYQHSTSGVLKNALDWASRPAGASALGGKPVAVVGATPGRTGTARAQADVRKVLAYNDMHVLHRPGVLIAEARRVFDDELALVDTDARDQLRALLEHLGARTRWLRHAPPPDPA